VTPEDVHEIVAAHFGDHSIVQRLARTELMEMKAQIIEHREKYLAMLRAKAEAEAQAEAEASVVR
jgi:hypothetical protein